MESQPKSPLIYKKSAFQFSEKDYTNYERINWENIYKSMLKDKQLRKILKKNHYYVPNRTEIHQPSEILETLPLKENLRVQYFTDHYQKNLSNYLNSQLTHEQLIHNLNFPKLGCKIQSVSDKTINDSPPEMKRLHIKDIKTILNRLDQLANEQKAAESSSISIINNSISTDINNSSITASQRLIDKSTIIKNTRIINPNPINPIHLKYSIIKNMIFEKFKEREHRIKENNSKTKNQKSKSQNAKVPKILYNIDLIEQEFLQKIDNKNLASRNPRHQSFYSNYHRKLSDGLLKAERKPLSYDPKEKSYKKIMENLKVQNIIDSKLKYQVNRSADDYLDSLKDFKKISQNYNKNIILKEPSILKNGNNRRCSMGLVKELKPKNNPLGLCDYLHHSRLTDQHKAGLISCIGISDMMQNENELIKGLDTEFNKVKCVRNLRYLERNEKIFEKKNATKKGRYSLLANNMIKNNETQMKPLKRSLKKFRGESIDENIERDLDEGNDSFQSLKEKNLDCLYKESIKLQNKIKNSIKSSFSQKIKRLIKLEELTKTIIDVNNKKLQN